MNRVSKIMAQQAQHEHCQTPNLWGTKTLPAPQIWEYLAQHRPTKTSIWPNMGPNIGPTWAPNGPTQAQDMKKIGFGNPVRFRNPDIYNRCLHVIYLIYIIVYFILFHTYTYIILYFYLKQFATTCTKAVCGWHNYNFNLNSRRNC